MKLSDVKGERVLDVFAEIAGPVISIAADEESMRFFQAVTPKDGQTNAEAFADKMRSAAPALMKNHKRDFVEILAAISGISCDEYLETLTLPKLLADVIGLLTDDGFEAFLSSQEQSQV